jgi:phage shock protein A
VSIMRRLSTVFQAKANEVLNHAEDPRQILDYSYERQLELLQQVRRGVADVATSRKRVELQTEQLQQSAATLETQARQALAQGREDLAREALTRKAAIAGQLSELETQHRHLAEEETKLTDAASRLEAKVEAFRTRKETIKASYTAAQAQTQIGEAISGISEEMGDVGMAMQRANDKIAQMEARAGAIDDLTASGALEDFSQPADHIQAELDKASASGAVEADMRRLRASLPGGAASGLAAPSAPAPQPRTSGEGR